MNNSEHEKAVVQLRKKLTAIAKLEAEVAPKGVSFAMRGQEDIAAASAPNVVASLRDPIAAADAVIGVLEDAKLLMKEEDAIAKRATSLPA